MSEWGGIFKNAIASLDSKLDQAMGSSMTPQESQEPDPTPVTTVESFDLPEDQLQFLDIYKTRFDSLASKLKHLAEENVRLLDSGTVNPAAATAKKIDLLMDEGRRLSVQELKLNNTIKKLRAQIAEKKQENLSQAVSDLQVSQNRFDAKYKALENEYEALKLRECSLSKQIDEQNAQLEYYKSLPTLSPAASSLSPLEAKLQRVKEDHEQARENWQTAENGLLDTIAGLELTADKHEEQISTLKMRLSESQNQCQELRTILDEERTSLHMAQTSLSDSSSRERDLKQHNTDLAKQLVMQTQALDTTRTLLETKTRELEELKAQPHPQEPQKASIPPVSIQSQNFDLDYEDTMPPPLEPLEQEQEHHETSQILERDDSFAVDGSFVVGSSVSANASADIHVLAKLNQANRKLEAQLLMANESLKQARREKDNATSEMIKYMNLAERLKEQEKTAEKCQELQTTLDKVLGRLGQKSEQVEELQADVADLKEMYQQQIQTLCEEIEALKRQKH